MISNGVISGHCAVFLNGMSKRPPRPPPTPSHLLIQSIVPVSCSDLSSNPFECQCKLFRLVSWLQEKGVRVRRPEAMLCDHPPELRHQPLLNVSLPTCGRKRASLDPQPPLRLNCCAESEISLSGLNYAACLEDSSSGGGGRSELVIFSSSKPGNFTREKCNSLCFAASHRYGGLGGRHECLCSTNSEPNFISESQCSAACTNPQVMEVCGLSVACLCCFVPHLINTTFRISSKTLL